MNTKRLLVVFVLMANLVLTACGSGGNGGNTTGTQPTGNGTGEAPGTSLPAGGPTPTMEPMPVPEPGNLSDYIEGAIALAVMLPYNGNPQSGCANQYWNHMQQRHLPGGQADVYQVTQVLGFLEAVSNGTAKLVKVGVRLGGGFVGLFSYNGQNWLMIIGESLTPTSYIPRTGVEKALSESRQVLKNPGQQLANAFRTTADCFKSHVPESVAEMAKAEQSVMMEFAVVPQGYTHNPQATRIAPVLDNSFPRVVLTPEIVGSGQLPIPIQGTPSFGELDSTMWNPEILSYIWTPNYGYHGLTVDDMLAIIAFTSGLGLVLGTVVVMVNSAPIWVPVVVIGGGSAAPLLALR